MPSRKTCSQGTATDVRRQQRQRGATEEDRRKPNRMYVYRLDDGGREGEEEDWAKKEKNFTIINHLVILEAETDSLYVSLCSFM